jgi:HlyD family secretion protein
MKEHISKTLLCLAMLSLASCGDHGDVPRGSGFIEATEITISTEVSGKIEHLGFGEGDAVESGMALALIDTTTYSLRLAEATAQRYAAKTGEASARLKVEKALLDSSLAEKEFSRISGLLKKGSANRQQYDQAETKYRQTGLAASMARSALKAAWADLARTDAHIEILRKQLADCRPVSPLDGKVITTYADPGELVGVGKPLMRLAKLDTVWVKIYLPAEDLTRIRLRDEARVDPEDGREEPIKGWVTWISPEAEFTPKNIQTREARADLVYAVKITVPNPEGELKIGMPVMVRIP